MSHSPYVTEGAGHLHPELDHIDDLGLCQCTCGQCSGAEAHCICPDCNAKLCGLHAVIELPSTP